jgi:hypothetical protein
LTCLLFQLDRGRSPEAFDQVFRRSHGMVLVGIAGHPLPHSLLKEQRPPLLLDACGAQSARNRDGARDQASRPNSDGRHLESDRCEGHISFIIAAPAYRRNGHAGALLRPLAKQRQPIIDFGFIRPPVAIRGRMSATRNSSSDHAVKSRFVGHRRSDTLFVRLALIRSRALPSCQNSSQARDGAIARHTTVRVPKLLRFFVPECPAWKDKRPCLGSGILLLRSC